ncbi:MAG TPA: inositol monophosphatase family protein, partial [Chitinophagales bacterium]|nr:inositol monophosphatase family protein [Chitinophagales bacterium]
NELFYATKNNGAYLNGSKIHVSSTSLLSDSLVATGFPYYDFDVLEKYISFLKFLMSHTRGIRRLGAASVDLCYTACGRFDAFFEHSLAPWDVAAGALIVQEAGGIVLDFNSGNNWLFGREMISVNPNISEEFLAAFRSHF